MKRFISILTLTFCAAMIVSLIVAQAGAQDKKAEEKKEASKTADKWHGYVVDAMCAKNMLKKDNPMEKAAKHTKECALEEACASSGFGLFHDGKYYKFDDEGDKKAKDLIEKSTTDKGIMVDVTGAMEGDKIMVASIAEMKMGNKETGKKVDAKKMEKKEEHKH